MPSSETRYPICPDCGANYIPRAFGEGARDRDYPQECDNCGLQYFAGLPNPAPATQRLAPTGVLRNGDRNSPNYDGPARIVDARDLPENPYPFLDVALAEGANVWHEVTEEAHDYALNVLPPLRWSDNAFFVGEPQDHDEIGAIHALYAKRSTIGLEWRYFARYAHVSHKNTALAQLLIAMASEPKAAV